MASHGKIVLACLRQPEQVLPLLKSPQGSDMLRNARYGDQSPLHLLARYQPELLNEVLSLPEITEEVPVPNYLPRGNLPDDSSGSPPGEVRSSLPTSGSATENLVAS